MFEDLRSFISFLEEKNMLVRVNEPIKSELEITEISQRLLNNNGKAVIFENVILPNGQKSTMPVLANLFGTVERVAHGLGKKPNELKELGELLAFLRQPKPPASIKEAFSQLPLLKTLMAMRPNIVNKAKSQEVILQNEEINLYNMPIQGCWPFEPAPLITWSLVITKGPTSDDIDDYNLGVYRMQVLSKNKTIMRWLEHRGGAQQLKRFKEAYPNTKMPVAVAIGTDPYTILSAVTPVPDNLSEYKFAGLLRGKKTDLVMAKTQPLLVPANAEIILEGYIDPNETAKEGPYGDHTGYYNNVEVFPVFTITAITTRKNPIYLTTHTGRPPDEPSVLAEALNDVFTPLIIQQFPEITGFYLPPEGCSYRFAIVSIKKSYAGHARKIMMGVWSYLRQFMYTKFVIIVDDGINIKDWKDVIWAISTNVDPARDSLIIENTPIDYLDFASPHSGLGSKMGIDATAKIPPETNREWGIKLEMNKETKDKIDEIWDKLFI